MADHYYHNTYTACLLTIAFSSILRVHDDSVHYNQKNTFIPGAFSCLLPFEKNGQKGPTEEKIEAI